MFATRSLRPDKLCTRTVRMLEFQARRSSRNVATGRVCDTHEKRAGFLTGWRSHFAKADISAKPPNVWHLSEPRQAGILVFGKGRIPAVMLVPPNHNLLQQPLGLGLEGLQVGPDLVQRAQRLRLIKVPGEGNLVADLGFGGVGSRHPARGAEPRAGRRPRCRHLPVTAPARCP